MVLHEMATNATKHGALSADGGRVSVAWAKETIDGAPYLMLRWVETGGPAVTEMPDRRGFGTELIERQLRHDLKGKLEVTYDAKGLRIVIALPADLIVERAEVALDPLANGSRRSTEARPARSPAPGTAPPER
jgi:two-component sensor histidine kinase